MIVFRFSLALILSLLLGRLVFALFWPYHATHRSTTFWFQWSLVAGLGIGLTSLTTFLTLLLSNSMHFAWFLLCEGVLLAMLSGCYGYARRSAPDFGQLPPIQQRKTMLSVLVFWAFLVSLVFASGMFLLRSVENPHGEPDAWYLWNLCARFLFRNGTFWKTSFSPDTWSHPDYPLLIPANVVRFWSFAGRETLIGPQILAFLFTFATIGLLVSALALLRGRTQGFLGGLVLAGTPYFIKHGASQYADVPLGFYMLAGLILLNMQHTALKRLLCLTGLALGFAVWTKNEGILFLVSFMLASALRETILFTRGVKRLLSYQDVLFLMLGLCPVLLTAWYFKVFLAPSNDLIASSELHHMLERALDWPRYVVIGKAFLRQIVEPYSLVYSTPFIFFGIYGLFLGVNLEQLKKPGFIIALFTTGFTFIGFFCIYIITPHDLDWHLKTSLSRLFLQLWPSVIFVALLCINSPDERFMPAEPDKS